MPLTIDTKIYGSKVYRIVLSTLAGAQKFGKIIFDFLMEKMAVKTITKKPKE
jgi:hypothetical protein